jgi:hypothetical protein
LTVPRFLAKINPRLLASSGYRKEFQVKYLAVISVLVASLVLCVGAQARTAWTPGTSYMVEETDASDLLEQTYDWAYCSGIPRFGHRGEFPYEEFRVFDCDLTLRAGGHKLYCSEQRYKSVKSTRPGYFQLRLVSRGDCY